VQGFEAASASVVPTSSSQRPTCCLIHDAQPIHDNIILSLMRGGSAGDLPLGEAGAVANHQNYRSLPSVCFVCDQLNEKRLTE